VADEFGITAERVRQICNRVTVALRRTKPPAPILERTLAHIAAEVPIQAAAIEARLADAHVTDGNFTLDLLRDAANVLGRRVPFVIEKLRTQILALPVGMGGATRVVLRTAKKCIRLRGAAKVEHVSAAVQQQLGIAVGKEITCHVLEACPLVEWLDEKHSWFWLHPISRNRLARQILKVISIARRISISELNAGLGRTQRFAGLNLPLPILRGVCSRITGCRLEGEVVVAEPALDPGKLLTRVEAKVARVLQEHGPVLPSDRFQELCLDAGVSSKTFYVYRRYSAFIKQNSGGLYELRGLH
jgi:hypothetical protein